MLIGLYRPNFWKPFSFRAQRLYGYPSHVISTVNDVGAPNVVAECEDLPPQVAEQMIAGLEPTATRGGWKFRADRFAAFQLNNGDGTVRKHEVARCILCNR